MAFNLKSLFSTVVKDTGAVVSFANKYGLTSLIPGGTMASSAISFITNLNNAIVGAEQTYSSVQNGGQLKKDSVKASIEAGFAAYKDVAEMRGETFSYDTTIEDKLIEAQLAALDLAAQFKASWKFTPIVK